MFVTKRHLEARLTEQRVYWKAATHSLATVCALIVSANPNRDNLLERLKVLVATGVGEIPNEQAGDPQKYRDAVSIVLQAIIEGVESSKSPA